MASQEPAYLSIARRKQTQRATAISPAWRLKTLPPTSQTNVLDIPRACGILTAEELAITENHDATDLVNSLAKGKLSSESVTRAFCKRAAVAQQVTNCLTEIFFDRAIARAKELDQYYKNHNEPIGPLHGLPISLKDSFCIKGQDATVGLATLAFKPSDHNSSLVDVLLRAGAVLYCKTNVPQTLMQLDSHNNLFGRTLNPSNTLLTAGGSSGGEGALLAMRGSVLGVGTDVGGSIRIPAMCNGLFGLKPSHGRVPYAGQESGSREGSEALGVRASAGPMATSLRDCEMFMRVMGEMQAWKFDTEVLPQEWTQQDGLLDGLARRDRKTKLRVGVVRTDGVTTPMPPVSNFISEVAGKLSRSPDVEVVEMNITPILSKCQKLFNALTGTDGGNHTFDLLEATGEPLSPWLSTRIKRGKKADVDRIRSLHAERAKLQAEFLKIWRREGGYWADHPNPGVEAGTDEIDIIICPVAPHTTPPIDTWNTASYTSSFVLLDYPGATLPVRPIGLSDLKGEIEGEVLGNWDKANRNIWAETDRKTWMGGWHCLQVLGRRREERVVLDGMRVLQDVLRDLDRESGSQKAKL